MLMLVTVDVSIMAKMVVSLVGLAECGSRSSHLLDRASRDPVEYCGVQLPVECMEVMASSHSQMIDFVLIPLVQRWQREDAQKTWNQANASSLQEMEELISVMLCSLSVMLTKI
ncbi:hypothetical protein BHE74_00027131 [Ensete ventricosum]|nr:hypothetical protein BHE74_00027131 [Ensete ventricosum]